MIVSGSQTQQLQDQNKHSQQIQLADKKTNKQTKQTTSPQHKPNKILFDQSGKTFGWKATKCT